MGAVTSNIDSTIRNIKLSNDSERIENFKFIYNDSKVVQEFFDNQIVQSPKTDYIARHKEKWIELEETEKHLKELGQQEFNFDDPGVNQDVIDAAVNERKRITEPVLNGERTGMYKAFKDFEDKGVFDIKGATVKTSKKGGLTPTGWKQLQAAMEIYRSKKFETFR